MKMQLALTRIKRCAMSEDNNIIVNNAELSAENTSETYSRIRNSVISAQSRIYNAVNSAMVQKPTGKSASRFILPAEKTTVPNTEKDF